MIWVLLGTAALILLVLSLRWVAESEPRNILVAAGTVVLVVIGIAAIVMVATGRVSALVPLAITVWALFQRFRTVKKAASWWGRAKSAAGRGDQDARSTIETQWLRMELDHTSGTLTGRIISGERAGTLLDDLSEADLSALGRQLQSSDPESARLLNAYMDRRFGEGRESRTGSAEQDSADSAAASGGAMSRKEAREILGLGPEASDEDIRAAHRRLMSKLHPDTGGSTYLASKINQAKEVLLKRR